jgi:hypothetical protein
MWYSQSREAKQREWISGWYQRAAIEETESRRGDPEGPAYLAGPR